MKDATYADRKLYRARVSAGDLRAVRLGLGETDLMLLADREVAGGAMRSLRRHRSALEGYIAEHPGFLESMSPLEAGEGAPPVVSLMCRATSLVGVGPMAAVAGAVAECIALDLAGQSDTLIIENGGDVYVRSAAERVVGIYAGPGPWEFSLGLRIATGGRPLGVCTSSGVIGHSFSAGTARAATVLASSCALADAAATALGNLLRCAGDIQGALEWVRTVKGVAGAVAMHGAALGAWGDVRLVDLNKGED